MNPLKKVIRTHQLSAKREISLEMPKGTQFLSLHAQNGSPVLYTLESPWLAKEKVEFRTIRADRPIPDDGCYLDYVGSWRDTKKSITRHIFRVWASQREAITAKNYPQS